MKRRTAVRGSRSLVAAVIAATSTAVTVGGLEGIDAASPMLSGSAYTFAIGLGVALVVADAVILAALLRWVSR